MVLSGNFDIGDYDQYGFYSNEEYDGRSGMAPSQPANPTLDGKTTLNIMPDWILRFSTVLPASFDIYSRKTKDMLLNYPLSTTSGFSSIRTNIGSVKNSGFEFLIDARIIDRKMIYNGMPDSIFLTIKVKYWTSARMNSLSREITAWCTKSENIFIVSTFMIMQVLIRPMAMLFGEIRMVTLPTNIQKPTGSLQALLNQNLPEVLNTRVSYAGMSLDLILEYK